jgi:lipopolysaccharide/colanic/teichoic acid biosynthesis glycosyltransferase
MERDTVPKNFEYFPPEERAFILSMRPALTGIGSIVFRDEESIVANAGLTAERCYRELIGPYKAKLEKWYCDNRNIAVYILLIVCTAWVIVFPRSLIYRKIWPSLPPLPDNLHSG